MTVLRSLGALILVTMMTGCGMIERITSDVAAVKTYLRGMLVPGQCRVPGDEDGPKSCYYRLEMADPDPRDKEKGLFSAKISPEVYTKSLEDCKRTNERIVAKYHALKYDCQERVEDYPDRDIVYTFRIEGETNGLTPGQRVDLESVPGSKHLRKSQIKFKP
jgi:hypothetical protein